MGRKTAKGRSTGEGGFVQVFHYLTRTLAWRSLRTQERAVWIELAGLYNGSNNGFIGLSARQASERCNINKDTASRCFATLQNTGFIELTQKGQFHGAATTAEWRLTHLRDDRQGHKPTRAFLRWRPDAEKSPVPKEGHVGPKKGTRPTQTPPIGPKSGDRPKHNATPIGPKSGDTLTSTMGRGAAEGRALITGISDDDREARPPQGAVAGGRRRGGCTPSTGLESVKA